jgi:hypothetical protein
MITLKNALETHLIYIQAILKASLETSFMENRSFGYFYNGADQRKLALCNS